MPGLPGRLSTSDLNVLDRARALDAFTSPADRPGFKRASKRSERSLASLVLEG